MPKIGVLMYTYNRTDDAYINMEIIRNVWKRVPLLEHVVIVHAFNGERAWWPEKYLEDEVLYLDNPGHFSGAEILLDAGIKAFQTKYLNVDYVIILASDTWLVKPEYVENVVAAMRKKGKYLATSVWGTKERCNVWKRGAALDFNILDLKWTTESALFPVRFSEFKEKYEELFFYNNQTVYPEIVFMTRFKQAISRSVRIPSENILTPVAESYIYRMREREPVHVNGQENLIFKRNYHRRTMYWPKIGLLTHHDPVSKQKAFSKWNLRLGVHADTFLAAKDLNYYNRGLDKHVFVKNGEEISYGD